MVDAGPAGDVDVLAHLDGALGADDHTAAVAPGVEPVRGEPVDPEVADARIRFEHHLAQVLEPGIVGVGDVAGARGDDPRVVGR